MKYVILNQLTKELREKALKIAKQKRVKERGGGDNLKYPILP